MSAPIKNSRCSGTSAVDASCKRARKWCSRPGTTRERLITVGLSAHRAPVPLVRTRTGVRGPSGSDLSAGPSIGWQTLANEGHAINREEGSTRGSRCSVASVRDPKDAVLSVPGHCIPLLSRRSTARSAAFLPAAVAKFGLEIGDHVVPRSVDSVFAPGDRRKRAFRSLLRVMPTRDHFRGACDPELRRPLVAERRLGRTR